MTNAADYTRRPREHLARLGLTLATRDEIVQGRDIASRTVGPTVATVETLQAVQDRTRCAAFAYHGVDGALAGVLCIIPLTLVEHTVSWYRSDFNEFTAVLQAL